MPKLITSSPIRKSRHLKTGQITSYGSGTGVDDGALQKGIAKAYTVLTSGQFSGNTNITINSKTDAHANACVLDNNTGLMWSRTASASVGPASNGLLPWTTTGADATAEGIFPYCAAANAALLAGYSDWRVPNDTEMMSLRTMEGAHASPNTTAFPVMTINWMWTSTTRPDSTTSAMVTRFDVGDESYQVKTNNYTVLLVRG